MMMMFENEIVRAAERQGLAPALVAAVVTVESNFNPYAWNPEPRYRYFWNVKKHRPFRRVTDLEVASKKPPSDFPTLKGDIDQEWWGQQVSWGLMQVMGAVAREHGFTGPYLTQLVDPATCLSIGCLHLADLVTWAHGDIEQALAAYNGGKGGNVVRPFRNHAYAEKVLSHDGRPRPLNG